MMEAIARDQKIEIHPAADLFPQMDGDGFQRLEDDIERCGVREPVWLDANGRLFDGRAQGDHLRVRHGDETFHRHGLHRLLDGVLHGKLPPSLFQRTQFGHALDVEHFAQHAVAKVTGVVNVLFARESQRAKVLGLALPRQVAQRFAQGAGRLPRVKRWQHREGGQDHQQRRARRQV